MIKSPLNLCFDQVDTNSRVCHCKGGFTALWLCSDSSFFFHFFAGVFLQSIRTQNSTLKTHMLSKNTSILTRNTITEVLIDIPLLIFPGMLLSIGCNTALGPCVLLALMMLIVFSRMISFFFYRLGLFYWILKCYLNEHNVINDTDDIIVPLIFSIALCLHSAIFLTINF